jgi:replicative DNA helicase
VAAEALPDPVFLDARGRPAELVANQVKWAIEKHGIDIVLYDYLQEFRSGSAQQDRRNEVSEVASVLKHAVTALGKTGMMFSQITIAMNKKYPDKHSIRESRDVSNAADTIVLGFTPLEDIVKETKSGNQETIKQGTKCLLVDKVKQGVKGAVPMKWNEKSKCFDAMPAPAHTDSFYDDLYDDFDNEDSAL